MSVAVRSGKKRGLLRVLTNVVLALVALALLADGVRRLARDLAPVPTLSMVRTWVGQKRNDEAAEALREILRRSPHDGSARFELARLHGAEKDYAACAEELRAVPVWWPNKAEAAFLEGQSWKLVDRMRDAEAAWNVCNAYDPLHSTPPKFESAANMELLELFAYEERWDDAHRVVWNAYDHADPVDHPAILVMRIRTEMERIAHPQAAERLRRYVAADPDDFEAKLALSVREQHLGNAEEADRLIGECLSARPDDLRARLKKLEILHLQGNVAAMEAVLAALPKGWENSADAWRFKGLAAETKGDWSAAAEAYGSALKLMPFEAEFHYKLSVILERLGRSDEAKVRRERNQALRKERAKLTTAFESYVELDKAAPDDPKRLRAIGDLADVCASLGWERVAQGWRRLLPAG